MSQIPETTNQPTQPTKKRGRPRKDAPRVAPIMPRRMPRGIPLETLIDLSIRRGFSDAAIGKILGVSRQIVQKRLAQNGLKSLGDFKASKADFLALQQVKILSSVSERDIQKAGLKDKIVSAGILFDKERLERGLSDGREIRIEIEVVDHAQSANKVGSDEAIDITLESNTDEASGPSPAHNNDDEAA